MKKDAACNIKEMVKAAFMALDEKKAENIVILNIGEVSVIADYFIIANGNNPSQITAMIDEVQKKLAELGHTPVSIEGIRNTSWVLMDYGDLIVHVFSKEDREFYDLERIWADCAQVDIDSIKD